MFQPWSEHGRPCFDNDPIRQGNPMTHRVLIPAERVPDTLSGIAFGGKYDTM